MRFQDLVRSPSAEVLSAKTRADAGHAVFVGLETPGASTVALLLSRIVQPKDGWLTHLG